MQVEMEGNYIKVIRDSDDPKIYSESLLLYKVKCILNEKLQLDLIKKLGWKDGHLIDDNQHIVRSRSKKSPKPHIMIFDGDYAIRLSYQDYNEKGFIYFDLIRDIFN